MTAEIVEGQMDLFPSGLMPESTAGVVDLVGNDPTANRDWERFEQACRIAADEEGVVDPNDVREELSNAYGLTIPPQYYSAFWRRARGKRDGFMEIHGWTVNGDTEGGNGGKPLRLYKLT